MVVSGDGRIGRSLLGLMEARLGRGIIAGTIGGDRGGCGVIRRVVQAAARFQQD